MVDQIKTGYFVNTGGTVSFVYDNGTQAVSQINTIDTGVAQPSYVGRQNGYQYKQLYEWQSFRAHQNYPFADSVGQNGLPNDLILDIWLTLPPGASSEYRQNFYIKKIQVGTTSIRIQLWYKDYQAQFYCGSFQGISKQLSLLDPTVTQQTVSFSTDVSDIPQTYTPIKYMIGGIYMGNTAGYLQGSKQLTYSSGRISQNCVRCVDMQVVSGLTCNNTTLTGDIKLVAGPGIKLNVDEQTNTVTIAVDFNQLYNGITTVSQAVAAFQAALGTPVTSINSVKPDTTGNINIRGVDCLQINSQTGRNMLTISNKCSSPCCSTNNASALQQNIQALQTQHQILKSYFTQQADNINYMQANLATIITGSNT